MTVRFTSGVLGPLERGTEFGETFRERVGATVDAYRELFARSAGRAGAPDLGDVGRHALTQIQRWAPALGEEIRGIAVGADLPAGHVAALNARTEILGRLRPAGPGECSAVVALGPDVASGADGGDGAEPVAMQNWDWYAAMADCWLVWEIPHPDGRRTVTLTEYGVVGKIGVNDRGVGCLFTILHHRMDGGQLGVPVHVIARRVLDDAVDVDAALRLIGSARVSASTSITVVGGLRAGRTAVCAELWPGGPSHVLPDRHGLLVHTNHFVAPGPAGGDTEPTANPDTLARYRLLRRRLRDSRTGTGDGSTVEHVRRALQDHTGGVGALCCHLDPSLPPTEQFQTLASVRLDLEAGAVEVLDGPPCGHGAL